MATSRRRERELARRRFERRRQAELERRARAKRRNTVIGAIAGTAVVIAVLVVVGVVVFSGGGSKAKTSVKPQSSTSASPSPSATPSAPKRCAKISPDPPAKGEPTVPDVKGKAPSKLVEKNITRGHGAPAKSGQTVTVKYVGVACSTGKAFDASYTDGAKKREFSFQLGAGKVIPGWDQGLVGMRAGGVRELVIPASLAYGTTGSGTQIKPNETLIFLVTMVKV